MKLELLPRLRLLPAPGHTDGMQIVVIETGGRPTVVGGDVAVWFGELDEPHTEGQLRVLGLDPELVWGLCTWTSRGDLIMKLNAFLAWTGVASRRGKFHLITTSFVGVVIKIFHFKPPTDE